MKFLLFFASLLLTIASSSVHAAQLSSIVVDANTGDVLSEDNADLANYPASLTKMMTLYLTFEELEQKKITLDQEFEVSEHASVQKRTNLHLQAGDRISLRDLILGVVTQSANDAAVVLAEGLDRSEEAFADRMTRKADDLGMVNTSFYNSSGLSDSRQHTTARDLSILARRLYHDFPREYHFFATEEFTYRGIKYENHNHLMKAFPGMDGIKTGYIHESGFNLAASVARGHRRIIGIVLGAHSAHVRDLKMAALLNSALGAEAGLTYSRNR